MNRKIHFGLIFVIFLGSGCIFPYSYRCQPWRDFFSQPMQAQREQFREMDLAKQFEIHFCGNHNSEPPRIGFYSRFIASRGSSAVPFLRKKVLSANGGIEVYDAVFILEEMDALGYFSLANEAALIDLLEDNIAKMRDGIWKELAEENLRRIRSRAGR